jgi:hypothetical protein
VYGAFLALGAYQDLQATLPNPHRLIESLNSLALTDGSWRNENPSMPLAAAAPSGATNTTAAAMALLRHLGGPSNPGSANWLLARVHPQGGFVATPTTPAPDLLSTATALHALDLSGSSIQPIKEQCLNFIDSLWSNEGGFYGHWGDDHLDCEYAFYALLALGHLGS